MTVGLLLQDFYVHFRCSSILCAVCPRFKTVRSKRLGGPLIDFHPDRALADGALLLEVLANCPGLEPELLDLWSCPGVSPATVSKAAACSVLPAANDNLPGRPRRAHRRRASQRLGVGIWLPAAPMRQTFQMQADNGCCNCMSA